MKMGNRPLSPISWRSLSIPYFHVVSYAFSRSKKTATTCSRFTKPSLTQVSKRTSWSTVLLFDLKPLWYLVMILFFQESIPVDYLLSVQLSYKDSWLRIWDDSCL